MVMGLHECIWPLQSPLKTQTGSQKNWWKISFPTLISNGYIDYILGLVDHNISGLYSRVPDGSVHICEAMEIEIQCYRRDKKKIDLGLMVSNLFGMEQHTGITFYHAKKETVNRK